MGDAGASDDLLFPGAAPLPPPIPRRFASFRPASETPAPVRFAVGFKPYAAHLVDIGADPSVLATDLHALVRVLAGDDDLGHDDDLREAAGIFLGNTIAQLYPRSTWTVSDEPEVGPGRMGGMRVGSAVRALVHEPERVEEFIDALSRSLDHDDRFAARHDATELQHRQAHAPHDGESTAHTGVMQFAGVLPPDAPDPRDESDARLRAVEFPLKQLCPQPALERLGIAGFMTNSGTTGLQASAVSFSYTLWRYPDDRSNPRNQIELDEHAQRSLDEEPPWPRPQWLIDAAQVIRYPMLSEAIRTTWHAAPDRFDAPLPRQLVDHTNHILRNRFREQLGLPSGPFHLDEAARWKATEHAVAAATLTVDGAETDAAHIDTDPLVYSIGFQMSPHVACTVVIPRDALPLIDLAVCSFTPES